MYWYNELYYSYKNNSDEIKNKAIAYGNSSYILIDDENPEYVNKFYINGYDVYGEKAIQRKEYGYGFKNEISMYKYANMNNLSYVPRMISYDDSKASIKLIYLKDYITIGKYINEPNYFSKKLTESSDSFFKALMKLLNSMEKDNFVHNNLTLDNIMIHPNSMELKVVNLKDSYIFNPSYNKDHSIFNYTKNELLYTLYKVIYPLEKDIFMKYFKYRNPDYYGNGNAKIGNFYRIGILQLFDEPFESIIFIRDEEIRTFVKDITFFNLYVNIISKDNI